MSDAERSGHATARAATYRRMALRAVPRLLGMLDRDEWSPTAGSFDREHWAWQFRDFPLTMLQWAMVPLAALYAGPWSGNPYAGAPALRRWLAAAIGETLRRQHRNGSFDSVAPFTQDHGVTLAMCHALCTTVRLLGAGAADDRLRPAVQHAVRRAAAFAARGRENYAFISNHRALFARAWLELADFLGDPRLGRYADAELDAILARQSGEGWYHEYDGADPGYETLGIAHLAECLAARPDARLRDSLARAVAFLEYFVHPDGSVGGVYGSRLTSLWFPSGLELLARDDPRALALASFVGARLEQGDVATPDNVDAENLGPLVWSYLRAADATDTSDASAGRGLSPSRDLPCHALSGARWFPEAGLTVVGTPHYYAVCNVARGGVGGIWSRGTGRAVYRDAGYVVVSSGTTFTSAVPGASVEVHAEGTPRLRVRTVLGRANRVQLTPARFLLLRLLNLTVFRVPWLRQLLTRRIVGRLVTRRTAGPYAMERSMVFESDRVRVRDVITAARASGEARLALATSFRPRHMGSAAYFHPADLVVECAATPAEVLRPGAAVVREREVIVGESGGALAMRGDVVATPVSGEGPAGGAS